MNHFQKYLFRTGMLFLMAACTLSCSWLLKDMFSILPVPEKPDPFAETNTGARTMGLFFNKWEKTWTPPAILILGVAGSARNYGPHISFFNESKDSITIFTAFKRESSNDIKEYFNPYLQYSEGDMCEGQIIKCNLANTIAFRIPLSELYDGNAIPLKKMRVYFCHLWEYHVRKDDSSSIETVFCRYAVLRPDWGELTVRSFNEGAISSWDRNNQPVTYSQLSGNFHFSGKWGSSPDAPSFELIGGTFDTVVYNTDMYYPNESRDFFGADFGGFQYVPY